MNIANRSAGRVGFVLGSALLVALAGCTTYVQPPPPHPVYLPPPVEQAPPPVVYAPPVESPVVVIHAETDFYAPLSPYGEWVVVGSYGRCWRPARVAVGWRPYCNGHWVRCDAGWYWASDEPWGWATYHYGRWDFTARFGWVWVPQIQWAPAWVYWHEGGGYVGWAPLPPSARISVSGSVEFNAALISPRAFVFVEQRRFLEPIRPNTVVLNNTTVINKTVNITKIKVVNKTVINEGPRTEVVERVSGRKVQAVPVRELRRKEETEVVARQPNIPSATEKKVQPTVRGEPEPREKKTVAPRGTRQVGKPAEPTKELPPPATRRDIREQKPAVQSIQPQAERQGRKEPRPQFAQPAEVKKSQRPPTEKQGETQLKSLKSGKGKSNAGKQGEKNKQKKDEKKQGEEQAAPQP
ncbi:MAG: hypothetical protein HY298_19020 [Verrucomicrobia bacterium]|nr:hypothetical protein [Verrucomicrobiota bacterium]